jgi:hypothetical protein
LLLRGHRFFYGWFRIGRLGNILSQAVRPNRQQN